MPLTSCNATGVNNSFRQKPIVQSRVEDSSIFNPNIKLMKSTQCCNSHINNQLSSKTLLESKEFPPHLANQQKGSISNFT